MTEPSHRLILVRHAKSDWGAPGLADHDRPLNPRGRRAARALGGWLATEGYVPGEVLCSSALRTRETWAGIVAGMEAAVAEGVGQAGDEAAQGAARPGAPVLRIEPALYHASPDAMLAVLRRATAGVVLMLGHNPGIAAFAHMLPVRPVQHPDFGRYPTAATLVVDFDIDGWSTLRPGGGAVVAFFTPRSRKPS